MSGAGQGFRYGRPTTEGEVDGYRDVLFRCFTQGSERQLVDAWIERAGLDNVRVLTDGGRAVAGLFVAPMGQFFGGRSVRTAGIAGVGVVPDARGGGQAKEMMRAAMHELRDDGYPLSTLYPSTYGLYRAAGYERAGGRWTARIGLRDLPVAPRELTVRAIDDERDRSTLQELYTTWAARQNGVLDRGPYIWGRVERPMRGGDSHAWVVEDGGAPVGYARWQHAPSQARPGQAHYDLAVVDVVALGPVAHARLLTLFADHAMIGGALAWQSHPADPFVRALRHRQFELSLTDFWMLRVLDVERALGERGWPAGLACELHLRVADDVLAANAGDYVVELADGRARVRRGGEGRVRLDVRALASLYSGHLSPFDLAASGEVEGGEADLALAQAMFAGPAPWCPDMF